VECLILDTGVLIGIARGTLATDIAAVEDDVAISAITASELVVGVELGGAASRARREFVAGVLARATRSRSASTPPASTPSFRHTPGAAAVRAARTTV